jgi:Flp pilus assembly protein CpaB
MKPKTLILMATAIVCGLGASYMTSRLLAERGSGEEQAKVAVLVAKKHLDMATPLKNPADLFETKEFKSGEEPKNAVTSLDQVKGKFLAHGLRKGDFLTTEDVRDSMTVIPIPPGMRAVGLRVNLEGIAGGWASLPGSRVDVINTVSRRDDDESGSRYLLENVLVLAADGAKDRAEGSGAMPASVVILALDTTDALRVATAKGLGPLTLVLRDPNDPSRAAKGRVSVTEVLRGKHASTASADGSEGGKPGFEEPGAGGEGKIPLIGRKPGAAKRPQVAKGGKPAAPTAVGPKQADAKPVEVAKAPDPQPLKEEPLVRKHVVTVVEGEHRRKVVFVLNDDGEVNQEEVTETPVPTPPAVTPRPPAPPAAAPRPGPRPGQPASAAKGGPGPRPGSAAGR